MASRAILVIPISRDRLSIYARDRERGKNVGGSRGYRGGTRPTFDMIESFENFHQHSGVVLTEQDNTGVLPCAYPSLAPGEVRLRDEIVGGSIGRIFSSETKSVAR